MSDRTFQSGGSCTSLRFALVASGVRVLAAVFVCFASRVAAQNYQTLNGLPYVNNPGVLSSWLRFVASDRQGTGAVVSGNAPTGNQFSAVVRTPSGVSVWLLPDLVRLNSGPIFTPMWLMPQGIARVGASSGAGFIVVGSSFDPNSGVERGIYFDKNKPSYFQELLTPTGTAMPQQAESRAVGISADPAAPFGQLIVGSMRRMMHCLDGSGGFFAERIAYGWPRAGAAALWENLELGKLLPQGTYCGVPAYYDSSALSVSPNGEYIAIGASASIGQYTGSNTYFDHLALVKPDGTVMYSKPLSLLGLPPSVELDSAQVFNNGIVVMTAVPRFSNQRIPVVIDANGAAFIYNIQSPQPQLWLPSESSFIRGFLAIGGVNPAAGGGARVTLFDPVTHTFSVVLPEHVFPNIFGPGAQNFSEVIPNWGVTAPNGIMRIRG